MFMYFTSIAFALRHGNISFPRVLVFDYLTESQCEKTVSSPRFFTWFLAGNIPDNAFPKYSTIFKNMPEIGVLA